MPLQTTVVSGLDVRKEFQRFTAPENLSLEVATDSPVNSDSLRRKVEKIDIDKFLETKPELTIDIIKKKLSSQFHHHAEHYLPKNANCLPPHGPWDHRIELLPGK